MTRWRSFASPFAAGFFFLSFVRGQYLCPNLPYVKVCDQCPNQCNGPAGGINCVRSEPHVYKCANSSWGNTDSTYMNLSCAPLGGVAERYPKLTETSPAYGADLNCNGAVMRGLWPYDEANMTFSIETMFRDPALDSATSVTDGGYGNTSQVLNAIYTNCLELRLTAVSAAVSSSTATGELVACTVTQEDQNRLSYYGLDVMACIFTNPNLDPDCKLGKWVNVLEGACVGQQVVGTMQLQDKGYRTLLRVGGPGNITACQPKYTLEVHTCVPLITDRRARTDTLNTH